ncbi:hypothetical protein GPECTOR_233g535 [Gonium pectorale]|uniref:Translation initiation factor IF- 2 domain-containing protein n=1 Tax=Gonium pectorale TaxID=33097 RepID=A0A150FWH2_GONPE|nr:hypothetical protein GPECTOR_233g535 [Gonium pectorale]|eukprot:KXZ41962.1 hypothetical protein GPECTOR_233g535 [Gonium pectorale]
MEAVLAMVEALATEQQQAAAVAAAGGGGYVGLKVVYSGVGPLSASDLHLAMAAGAHVVLFNTGVGAKLEATLKAAQSSGVRLLSHNIVYSLLDAIRAEVAAAREQGAAASAGGGAAAAALVEVGSAEVLATFPLTSGSKRIKDGRIAGVRVLSGELTHGSSELWRVLRGDEVLWEGPASSLRQHKQDVGAVAAGGEAGVVLGGGVFSDFQRGDRLVCLRRGGG